ncbi:FeoB small GTPase domain-containing protein [Chloroflexota bacterium]
MPNETVNNNKILLMGNPNVGKSVVFSRLTGVRTIASNYPGTTVGFTQGYMKLGEKTAQLIDVPGTYNLSPLSEADAIARKFLDDGDVIINVIDATNLERNLYLTLELLEQGKPMVVALNVWDDALHQGIQIDIAKLEQLLGVPVVPTVATTGQGFKELAESVAQARAVDKPALNRDERWLETGRIIDKVQKVTHRHHTWRETLADASVKPLPGALIAMVVLAAAFLIVRFIGESLIGFVLDPFFEGAWTPLMLGLNNLLDQGSFISDILIGNIGADGINYPEAFGLLTTGLYVPFGMVLPYIVSFYLILGILEDTGYLPRLAVLLDTLMHRIGLHGYAIIPNMLGLGCNVPAIMATRILESKKERFIAATLISIAVPCAALQAMVFGLVGAKGGQYVLMVYGTLAIVWLVLGFLLNRLTKGFSPELLLEIPPYRFPPLHLLWQKLWMRSYHFLKEATPIVLASLLGINILLKLGVFDAIANFTAPVITGLLGLPKEAVLALVLGFLRKDVAIGMLAPLNLTAGQLVIGSVVLAMFFPCVATITVLIRELGIGGFLRASALMVISALTVGGILNIFLD